MLMTVRTKLPQMQYRGSETIDMNTNNPGSN